MDFKPATQKHHVLLSMNDKIPKCDLCWFPIPGKGNFPMMSQRLCKALEYAVGKPGSMSKFAPAYQLKAAN